MISSMLECLLVSVPVTDDFRFYCLEPFTSLFVRSRFVVRSICVLAMVVPAERNGDCILFLSPSLFVEMGARRRRIDAHFLEE